MGWGTGNIGLKLDNMTYHEYPKYLEV